MEPAILQGVTQASVATGDKQSNPESAGSAMSRQRINKFVTSNRRSLHRHISSTTWSQPEAVIHATCELDSHADTCVAGPNCQIVEFTNQVIELSAFSKEHTILQDVPVVTAATAYDDPSNGITYILILGQAIWMGDKVECTLLCPN